MLNYVQKKETAWEKLLACYMLFVIVTATVFMFQEYTGVYTAAFYDNCSFRYADLSGQIKIIMTGGWFIFGFISIFFVSVLKSELKPAQKGC